MLSAHNHLIRQAKVTLSPNCDDRPDVDDIQLVVIHNISLPPGEFGGPYIEHFFCNQLDFHIHPYFEEIQSLCVSSHLLIDRKGELTQFVPFNRRAWHAGKSCYQGREACNDFSIGIELEGTDDTEFTEQQYTSLVEVVDLLLKQYPRLSATNIAGHSDIAPGRKTDPGPHFKWDYFHQLLAQKQREGKQPS